MRQNMDMKGQSAFVMSTVHILAALTVCAIIMGTSVRAEDVLAVTSANNLIRFDARSPGTLISTLPITGLQSGEKIVGIDFRTVSGQLYGIAISPTPPGGAPPPVPNFTGRLYQINPVTGVAAQVGLQNPPQNPLPNFSTTLTGSHYSFSYDPSSSLPDVFRVVNENGQNIRINAGTGTLVVNDGALIYNDANSNSTPHVVAIAYNNKIVGANGTSLFAIDSTLAVLDSMDPFNGFLNSIGKLGIAIGDNAGFAVSPFSGTAYAALQPKGATASTLYAINLATGTLTTIAASGSADPIVGLALPTPPPTFGFAATNDVVNTATKHNPGLGKFNLADPTALIAQTPITGLPNSASLAGIDFRPSTGDLYGLTTNGNSFGLFKIDTKTGAATAVNSAFAIPNTPGTVPATRYSINFDPVRDLLRVESNNGADSRLDPATANILAADPAAAYDAADVNAGSPPDLVAVAYTNKNSGATSTTLLAFDLNLTVLATQNPQDSGTLNTQMYSNNGTPAQLTVALPSLNALQISPDGRAFALNNATLYLVNLVNGTLQQIGTVTRPSNSTAAVRFLAIPSQTAGTNGSGSGVIQFASASYTVVETNTAQITVSRTGGSSGVATIDYAIGTGGTAVTPGGLATPNTDYAPLTGTLTFLDGEVSRTINVPTFDDKTLDLFKTVNLTLKNPVGAALGAQSTAVLIIADKDDVDGDGFTNELETLAGTDPNNASSTPFSGNPAGTAQTLTVTKMTVKLNFAKSGSDSVSVSGTVPFSGNVTGQQVLIDIGGVGGVLGRFSLDKTGSDKKGISRPSGGTNSFKLQTSKNGGQAKFTVTLSKNTFASFLPGLPNADLSKQAENLQVNLYFNNVDYQVTKALTYTAKKGKGGGAQLAKTK